MAMPVRIAGPREVRPLRFLYAAKTAASFLPQPRAGNWPQPGYSVCPPKHPDKAWAFSTGALLLKAALPAARDGIFYNAYYTISE